MVTKKEVEKIQGLSFEHIKGSPEFSSLLLKVYGKLWVCMPKLCVKSLEKYHREIRADGINKLNIYKEMIKVTCKLKGSVTIYEMANAKMWNEKNITDEAAVRLIKENSKTKNQFEILPACLTEKKEIGRAHV